VIPDRVLTSRRTARLVVSGLALGAAVVGVLGLPGSGAAAESKGTVVAVAQAAGGGALVCADASGDATVSARHAVNPSGGVLADGSLWVSSETDDVAGLTEIDPADGSITGRVDVGGSAQTVIKGTGSSVWVRTVEGELVKVDTRRGSVAARVELPSFTSHLASGGDVLWAANEQGAVYRVDGRSGRLEDTVLQVAGASSEDLPVVGALATNPAGDLWIALSRESVLLRVNAESNRVADTIRYAAPVAADAPFRPATALAIAGRYGWVGIDDAAGSVDEPTLVRVNLRTGRVRAFADEDLDVGVVAATERDVWLGEDGIQHFDPATNRSVDATVPPGGIATTGGVRALDPRPCTAPGGRAPQRSDGPPADRSSADSDPRGGPRLTDAELRAIDYSRLVVSDLPPAWDQPPASEDLAGTPYRFVLCNQVIAGPATYVAGTSYDRGGPDQIRQRVSGWPANQANEIFDRARRAVDQCTTKTVQKTTFVPTDPPAIPKRLGDEHLVLSRAVPSVPGLVFTEALIRHGQLLYYVRADSILSDIAPRAADALDRIPSAEEG
jgi:hypothetical protein